MALFEADRSLRVVVFFSGGASGFRYLREHDDGYGTAYEVVGAFTDDPSAPGIEHLEDAGVEVLTRDIRAFYDQQDADTGDMALREEFDAETTDRVAAFDPDLVVLSGYMWILTEPVVGRWPVVNVHPADLTVTDADGERRYVGADPVHDAIVAGEAATRSTVHLVTPAVDDGPLLVRSKPHPVNRDLVETLQRHDADGALRDYVDAHQEWMKWAGDGPALAAALELVAAGRVELDEGAALVDGEPGPLDLG